jgi:hypothetical protein
MHVYYSRMSVYYRILNICMCVCVLILNIYMCICIYIYSYVHVSDGGLVETETFWRHVSVNNTLYKK